MILAFGLLEIVIILAIIGFGIFSSVNENVFGVIITLITALILTHFFIMDLSTVHWAIYVVSFLGYFLIGGLYALAFSWPNYIKRNADNILKLKKSFDDDDWKKVHGYESFKEMSEYRTRYTAVNQKPRIITYICGWIWDLIWKVVKNPIKWSYETVYNIFGRGYEAVANRTVDKIVGDK